MRIIILDGWLLMNAIKYFSIFLLIGLLVTSVTWFFEYEYCIDGMARGFPFAIKRPSCGPSLFPIRLEGVKPNGQIIAVEAVPLNIIIIAGLSLLISKLQIVFDKVLFKKKINDN